MKQVINKNLRRKTNKVSAINWDVVEYDSEQYPNIDKAIDMQEVLIELLEKDINTKVVLYNLELDDEIFSFNKKYENDPDGKVLDYITNDVKESTDEDWEEYSLLLSEDVLTNKENKIILLDNLNNILFGEFTLDEMEVKLKEALGDSEEAPEEEEENTEASIKASLTISKGYSMKKRQIKTALKRARKKASLKRIVSRRPSRSSKKDKTVYDLEQGDMVIHASTTSKGNIMRKNQIKSALNKARRKNLMFKKINRKKIKAEEVEEFFTNFIYKNASIGTVVEFIGNDEDGDLYFFHPLTNAKCESLDQCFSGWSEQDLEIEEEWEKLSEFINNIEDINQEIYYANNKDIIFDNTGNFKYKTTAKVKGNIMRKNQIKSALNKAKRRKQLKAKLNRVRSKKIESKINIFSEDHVLTKYISEREDIAILAKELEGKVQQLYNSLEKEPEFEGQEEKDLSWLYIALEKILDPLYDLIGVDDYDSIKNF